MFVEIIGKVLQSNGLKVDIFAQVIDGDVTWLRAYDPVKKKDIETPEEVKTEIITLAKAEKLALDAERPDYLAAVSLAAEDFKNVLATYAKHAEVNVAFDLKQSLDRFIEKVGV